jgi:hypothetical protein
MITNDLSAQQRAARLVWLLSEGGEYTTSELADLMDWTYSGIYQMLHEIKEALPALTSENGKWSMTILKPSPPE